MYINKKNIFQSTLKSVSYWRCINISLIKPWCTSKPPDLPQNLAGWPQRPRSAHEELKRLMGKAQQGIRSITSKSETARLSVWKMGYFGCSGCVAWTDSWKTAKAKKASAELTTCTAAIKSRLLLEMIWRLWHRISRFFPVWMRGFLRESYYLFFPFGFIFHKPIQSWGCWVIVAIATKPLWL